MHKESSHSGWFLVFVDNIQFFTHIKFIDMEEKEKKTTILFGINPDGKLIICQESENSFNNQKVVLNEQEADTLRRFLNVMKGGKE